MIQTLFTEQLNVSADSSGFIDHFFKLVRIKRNGFVTNGYYLRLRRCSGANASFR